MRNAICDCNRFSSFISSIQSISTFLLSCTFIYIQKYFFDKTTHIKKKQEMDQNLGVRISMIFFCSSESIRLFSCAMQSFRDCLVCVQTGTVQRWNIHTVLVQFVVESTFLSLGSLETTTKVTLKRKIFAESSQFLPVSVLVSLLLSPLVFFVFL